MSKSPEMVNALDLISQAWYGRPRSEALAGSICVICGDPAVAFRNELSAREWSISGMCQKCQDAAFSLD